MASGLPSVIRTSDLVPGRERALPVEPALTSLFPDAGLRRGHVVSFGGVAARSLAFAAAARAVSGGSWLAVIGVDDFGVEAAIEHGVAPERIVHAPASGPAEWVERLAIAADGFELLLTSPPRGAERQMRRLRQRLQARGSVLLVVPPIDGVAPAIGADIDLTTDEVAWVGIEHGAGRLMARRVAVVSAGRRMPRPVGIECWLPGPDGRVDIVQTGRSDVDGGLAPATLHRAS